MAALIPGTNAPEFTLPTMDGSTFSLSDALKWGPVVAVFLKISCPVCQYALPYVERMYQAHRGKGVTFVAISQNPMSDTASFNRQYGITMPVALDDTRKYPVSNAYGLTNVPTLFYIAEDGRIEVSSVGWVKADLEQVSRLLAEKNGISPPAVFRPGEEVADFRAG